MASLLAALLAGLMFGLGLLLSGMADPAKVLGFLDLAGRWDPSLTLVMAGAIAAGSVSFAFAKTRTVLLLGEPMRLPTATRIDPRLLAGSTLFGIGRGLAGSCPGAAMVALGMGRWKAAVSVLAMLACMALFELLEQRREHGSLRSA